MNVWVGFLTTTGLGIIAPVVALIVVLSRARGRRRRLGAIGAVLIAVSALADGLISQFLPALQVQLGWPLALLDWVFLPGDLIGLAGLVLLGAAVVVAPRKASDGIGEFSTGPVGTDRR